MKHKIIAPNTDSNLSWQGLYGPAFAKAIYTLSNKAKALIVVVVNDTKTARLLKKELDFFSNNENYPILHLPDWDSLIYDIFSPNPLTTSQRLQTLSQLPAIKQGILILTTKTLCQKIAPKSFILGNSLNINIDHKIEVKTLLNHLTEANYLNSEQVSQPGEYTVRGSVIDIFPMGANLPYRFELFDDQIETIRTFDPDSQRTINKVSSCNILPPNEFPFDKTSRENFCERFKDTLTTNTKNCKVYQDVKNKYLSPGLEYYLPLFFENTATIFEYITDQSLIIDNHQINEDIQYHWEQINQRFEQLKYDIERPLMHPSTLYLNKEAISERLNHYPNITILENNQNIQKNAPANNIQFNTTAAPKLSIEKKINQLPLDAYIEQFNGKILITTDSIGRRELLIEQLKQQEINPKPFDSYQHFITSNHNLGIVTAPLLTGVILHDENITILTESELSTQKAHVLEETNIQTKSAESIIQDLSSLTIGTPIVHEDNGVGRYLGLQTLEIDDNPMDFITIEYVGQDKLYVPISDLHLVNRYTGGSTENAPLHKLGGEQWQRIKRKAAEKAYDVAAELLDIYAKREIATGQSITIDNELYQQFAASFPFEETPDQAEAIQQVIHDLKLAKPMDRVVCGDVGFGKTEVALRAAFLIAIGGKQVALLVPTTLLAQQHFQTFNDRLANWPINIAALSRFQTKKQTQDILKQLESGKIDIVIGTHKLLQPTIQFKKLGLVIIDEEHRFGVKQKDQFKKLRAQVDLLALTATPIPRTLNMAMSALRDLSIIASPPPNRLSISTFVSTWNNNSIREACQREIQRGGQIYFLHNAIDSIERIARELKNTLPELKIQIAHGRMPEKELERIMLEFHRQQFNLLLCTTIIESGIDIPNANTIIINRADKLGLAQLHQLRGRVGRSFHRAYAYLITPEESVMTKDAQKRISAIELLDTLGVGFTLATHDMEIRGAGELLGDEQSGQIQQIGFTLYAELLERAVLTLKQGKQQTNIEIHPHNEVNLHLPAIIPESYLPDVHTRLTLYKRIANAKTNHDLRALKVEMIDRFGLLPEPVQYLFKVTEIKLIIINLGIQKLEIGEQGGRILFSDNTAVEPETIIKLIQQEPAIYQLYGENKLRINLSLPNYEDRIHTASHLINQLSSSKAT